LIDQPADSSEPDSANRHQALTVAVATAFVSLWRMTPMPLSPYKGPLPPLTEVLSEVASRLSGNVRYLSATIGERNVHSAGSFEAITDYLEQSLVHAGYTVTEQPYRVEGHGAANLEAQLLGSEIRGSSCSGLSL
jgi:hypothetical protein